MKFYCYIIVSTFCCFFGSNQIGFAQDLCNKTGVEAGKFTFLSPTKGCAPLNVQLKDESGGTGVKYIYNYHGEEASKLDGLSTTATSFIYLSGGVHTILQYGKKNGKEMYYCSTVEILAQPKFTYNACNGNFLEITIPKDSTNTYDYYVISWDDGFGTTTKVLASDLPASVLYTEPSTGSHNYRTTASTRLIKVEGYLAGQVICPAIAQTINFDGGGTDFPHLTRIELSSDSKQATIQLEGGKYTSTPYILYQRSSTDTNYPATGTTVQAGKLTVTIADTTKSYCFKVTRQGKCSLMESDELCTISLQASASDYQHSHLEWTAHFSQTEYPFVNPSSIYTVYRQEGSTLTQISVPGLSYDDVIDCQKKYCYQIGVNVTTETNYHEVVQAVSLSQKRCIDRSQIHPPAMNVGLVSVNDKNAVEMQWTDNSVWTAKRDRYIFTRATSKNGTFEKIDSIKAVPPPPAISYTDSKIDASQQQYCYKTQFVDQCGSVSLPSPPFCTILLTGKGASLEWTPELPFDAAINKYEVEAFDEATGIALVEAAKGASQTTYEAQLDKFQKEAKYRIKATSATGEVSYSNVYIIPINAAFLFPEAFSPNNDGHNENFVPIGRLQRITNFKMIIYNRWGNVVYEASNIQEGWNGKLSSGEIAPSGMYAFKVEANLDDGKQLTSYGKVLLLR